MAKQPVSVVLCDCSFCLTDKVDIKRIKEGVLKHNAVKEILVLDSPCTGKDPGIDKVASNRVLFAGCSLMEKRGIYDTFLNTLKLSQRDCTFIDIRDMGLNLYGPVQGIEDYIIRQVLSGAVLLSGKEEVGPEKILPYERILIFGSGISGLSMAKELPPGIPVDILETGENGAGPGFLYEQFSDPGLFNRIKEHAAARENTGMIPLKELAFFVPNERGYKAFMRNGKSPEYGAIVFAPERVEEKCKLPGVYSLTETYEALAKNAVKKGTLLFLMDYKTITGPEVYGDMLKAAALIKEKNLAEVFVCAQNIQVCIRGQEELYDSCREAGVVFIKYDNRLTVKQNNGSLVIEGEYSQTKKHFRFDSCDMIIIPGRAHLPESCTGFAEMLGLSLPEKRYSQEDSLWLLPNRTTRNGVFTTGMARENTGPRDLYSEISSCAAEVVNYIRGSEAEVNEQIPVVDDEKCAYCLTCVRVCPFGAMTKDPEKGAAKVIPSFCHSCGICAGECPAEAIELRNMEMETLHKGIKTLAT